MFVGRKPMMVTCWDGRIQLLIVGWTVASDGYLAHNLGRETPVSSLFWLVGQQSRMVYLSQVLGHQLRIGYLSWLVGQQPQSA